MTKIIIEMELDSEFDEPDHPMGITEEGHIAIQDALSELGHDITVSRAS